MVSMDVIGSHAARLPALDDRWTPRAYARDELVEGLLSGAVAGLEVSHPLDNVLRNIRLLHEGDPDKQFGMTGLQSLDPDEVLDLVGRASGFEPDRAATTGPVPVDPELVLDACAAVGDRLAGAVRRGERVVLATGHPVGLAHLYIEVGRLLRAGGVAIIEPADGTDVAGRRSSPSLADPLPRRRGDADGPGQRPAHAQRGRDGPDAR